MWRDDILFRDDPFENDRGGQYLYSAYSVCFVYFQWLINTESAFEEWSGQSWI